MTTGECEGRMPVRCMKEVVSTYGGMKGGISTY